VVRGCGYCATSVIKEIQGVVGGDEWIYEKQLIKQTGALVLRLCVVAN
jgi:copper chaperone CopZ